MADTAPDQVTASPLIFIDANVLFSAALGGEAFDLLLALARRKRIRLVTSRVCEHEARRNLERKRPERVDALADVVRVIPPADIDPAEHIAWASELVGDADAHVLAAARTLGCVTLVTGDLTHFGSLMDRTDLPVAVRTPRAFLLEGPPPPIP